MPFALHGRSCVFPRAHKHTHARAELLALLVFSVFYFVVGFLFFVVKIARFNETDFLKNFSHITIEPENKAADRDASGEEARPLAGNSIEASISHQSSIPGKSSARRKLSRI